MILFVNVQRCKGLCPVDTRSGCTSALGLRTRCLPNRTIPPLSSGKTVQILCVGEKIKGRWGKPDMDALVNILFPGSANATRPHMDSMGR